MNQVVMVHFFGKFCLESKNGRLDEETIHSKKISFSFKFPKKL